MAIEPSAKYLAGERAQKAATEWVAANLRTDELAGDALQDLLEQAFFAGYMENT